MACVARGCVVGDVLSRIGWRAAAHVALLAPPPALASGTRLRGQRVGNAAHLRAGCGRSGRLTSAALARPSPREPRSADSHGSRCAMSPPPRPSPLPTRGSAETDGRGRRAAAPAHQAWGEMAYTASTQIEGVAALRYPIAGVQSLRRSESPPRRGGVGRRLVRARGSRGHCRTAVRYRPLTTTTRAKALANPALLASRRAASTCVFTSPRSATINRRTSSTAAPSK